MVNAPFQWRLASQTNLAWNLEQSFDSATILEGYEGEEPPRERSTAQDLRARAGRRAFQNRRDVHAVEYAGKRPRSVGKCQSGRACSSWSSLLVIRVEREVGIRQCICAERRSGAGTRSPHGQVDVSRLLLERHSSNRELRTGGYVPDVRPASNRAFEEEKWRWVMDVQYRKLASGKS